MKSLQSNFTSVCWSFLASFRFLSGALRFMSQDLCYDCMFGFIFLKPFSGAVQPDQLAESCGHRSRSRRLMPRTAQLFVQPATTVHYSAWNAWMLFSKILDSGSWVHGSERICARLSSEWWMNGNLRAFWRLCIFYSKKKKVKSFPIKVFPIIQMANLQLTQIAFLTAMASISVWSQSFFFLVFFFTAPDVHGGSSI